eukprot:CAMPEP_0183734558 /NCGR_PEP_ID=MMETSP0737-20130205/44105_1 /TAXON_ID=385413 /ORGANISM="Thalassiosira miniscula, Strain CCMP1093" /LENGTH=388 /DNA_ID=CAMNT_0025968065 /DNA_START=77 /DNA_END=1243 /DNA_ORIENTATION=-
MKYFLFDLIVALSVAVAIPFTYQRIGSFFYKNRDANGNCVNHDKQTFESTNATTQQAFYAGDIVEVYEPKLDPANAFVAKIVRASTSCGSDSGCKYSDHGDSVQYDVQLGIGDLNGGVIQENIRASAIRPAEPFDQNTHALCDDGKSFGSKLLPCTIDFDMPNSITFTASRGLQQQEKEQRELPWFYSVSVEVGGEMKKKIMPVSRIRRTVVQEDNIIEDDAEKCDDQLSCEESRQLLRTPTIAPERSSEESSDSSSSFPVGSVVEINAPDGYFAFPATVTGVTNKKYHLTHGITQFQLKNIESKFVHPYKVYNEGTEASCNVGKLRNLVMVPCTIISQRENDRIGGGNDDILYEVSAKMLGETQERILYLPRMRIQRRFKDIASEGR